MSFTSGLTSITNALGITSPNNPPSTSLQSVPVDINSNPTANLTRKIQSFPDDVLNNWNKDAGSVVPYYFKIVEYSPDNGWLSADGKIQISGGFNTDTFYFYIPPSAISVQNIFAINVAATNQGILEEHNGMVFRNIQVSGTTGLWPAKPNRQTVQTGLVAGIGNAIQSLFPATTSAISSMVQKAKNVANAVTGGKDNDLDKSNTKLQGLANISMTGWFQFWQLNNFLIAYSEYKKNSGNDGANIRLVFGSKKDNIEYVVTPLNFTLKRDIANPLLYRYDIALKAWDITTSSITSLPPPADIPTPDAQSIVKSVTEVLTDSRQTIQAASAVLQGVNSDLISMVNVANQGLLLLNDTAGLVSDVGTFGSTFSQNAQSLLLYSTKNQTAIIEAVNDPSVRLTTPVQLSQISTIKPSSSLSTTNTASLASVGVTAAAFSSQTAQTGEQKVDPQKQSIPSAASTVVAQALNTTVLQTTTIDQLDIPPVIQAGIDATRQASQALTAGDIQNLTNELQQTSDNYSISLGAMDPVYAATYNIPYTPVLGQAVTLQDIINEAALQDSKTAFLSTLATGQFFAERDPDPFLAANQSLQDQDILQTPNSSIAVPFQRGATLDTLAQQYLGDAKRSREIEVLNSLRAPYIDDVGFTLPITSVNGRRFVVTDITNLIIGQGITISSSSAASTNRNIINIQNLSNGEWSITVDGLPNLSMFTPTSSPILFSYLPGTVGPGDTILIPSSVVPDQFAAIRPTLLYNNLTNAEKVFKVDMALDLLFARDLSVSPSGDVQLSYGYDNASQALRLAVEIEQGELDRHSSYGLAVPIGSRNSDLSIGEIESAISNTVSNDPRFASADVAVTVDGSVVTIDVSAQGSSGTGQVPVTFEIGLA